ncbi:MULTISPECIES: hypothetical protein [Methanobacterium]|jgi:hypothetical protein|uniref:hypothetical protein n=1 Tax=Methanobacterium TaxID=2160 RepID=UPI00159F1C36|nr:MULTISPECIES: hypothetical protein [Methanobacterium]
MSWLIDIIWKFVSFWLLSKFGIFGRIVIGMAILNRLVKSTFMLFRFMSWFMR